MALKFQPSTTFTTTLVDSSSANRTLTLPNSNGIIASIDNLTSFTTTLTSAHTANRTIALPDKDCTLTDGLQRVQSSAGDLATKTFFNLNVPTYAKEIMITYNNISATTDSIPLIRLTPSDGVTVVDGYESICQLFRSSEQGVVTRTDGFTLTTGSNAGYEFSGICKLFNVDSNTWLFQSGVRTSAYAIYVGTSVGYISLLSKLITLNFVLAGSGTFDSGSVNAFYK